MKPWPSLSLSSNVRKVIALTIRKIMASSAYMVLKVIRTIRVPSTAIQQIKEQRVNCKWNLEIAANGTPTLPIDSLQLGPARATSSN